jgi:hypothetical protein
MNAIKYPRSELILDILWTSKICTNKLELQKKIKSQHKVG